MIRLCLLLLAFFPAGAVELRSRAWNVTFDPVTLATTARLPDGRVVAISSGQPGFPSKQVTASASLKDNALTVHFVSEAPAKLTWPVYSAPENSVSYIIPKAEGLLVDPRSPAFRSAAWPHELDTMEEFSLPLWGVMGTGWTLTYLLENPFDNTFRFRDDGQALSWSLEHEFKRNWKVKEFGVVVVLGPESPVEPAREYRRRLIASGDFVSMKQKIAKTPEAEKLLGAAHSYIWDISTKLLGSLKAAGLDRLWIGIPGMEQIQGRQEAVAAAKAMGYLIGPYDSYDSIHSPHEKDTWETAQFDQQLYEDGPIVGADGKKMAGFKKKGYWLSPVAARPYMERRVTQAFAGFAFNSFFMDCDAAGDVRDNYSQRFAGTEADDMHERLARMQWIVDRFHVPIGSEVGQWYAAPVIHFGHGMMTPVFGYNNPRFRQKTSPSFIGAYWPPDGPAVFLKPSTLPDDYRAIYFDPRSRIPLFQTAFHDSVITTHHWERPSLKFSNVATINRQLELLYSVPPLYHLNEREFAKNGPLMAREFRFFSPLHRETALLPMADFRWLTEDRLVQETRFGEAIEMVANFRAAPFEWEGVRIPAGGVAARHVATGRVEIFQDEVVKAAKSTLSGKGKLAN